MPHPTTQNEEVDEGVIVDRRLGFLVRSALLAIAVGLVAVFTIAIYLNPYRDGRVWHEGTHQQLGLQPCTFKTFTRLPCPSCGMTSSFAFVVRGDLWNSVQANAVGTMLALCFVLMIPWALACALRGRVLLIADAEAFFLKMLVAFFVFMLLRWLVVVASIVYLGM